MCNQQVNQSQSIDSLLARATCVVLINNKPIGTAWLIKDSEHLLTAGHVLGKNSPHTKVNVQFLDDDPRMAIKVHWSYQPETGDDFAILKLIDPPLDRRPLSVSLDTELPNNSKVHARGYGKTFKTQSVGKGEYLGLYTLKNSSKYCLFEIDSKQLGEPGYSGAAIFSETLQQVVALQIEATTAFTGAQRDTLLAMPLYRIAEIYPALFGESSSPLPTIQMILAGPSTDFTSKRRALFLEILVELLNITLDDIRILNITEGTCGVTLQLPEYVASQLLDPGEIELLRSIEAKFIAKAIEEGVEPHHFRIIRVRPKESESLVYELVFANRESELQELLKTTDLIDPTSYCVEICAPSGYGKTYLLDQLEKEFREREWQVIRIDFAHSKAPNNDAEFLFTCEQQLNQGRIETINQLGGLLGGKNSAFLLDNVEFMSHFLKNWLVESLLPNLQNRVKPPRVIAMDKCRIPQWHKFGRPSFDSLPLSSFHESIINKVLKEQVNKRDDCGQLQEILDSHWYRGWAKEIFYLTKGHPLCIYNIIRWLDLNQNFNPLAPTSPIERSEIFFKQIVHVVEEKILGHIVEQEILELVRILCVLRMYHPNVIQWITYLSQQKELFPKNLKEYFSSKDSMIIVRELNTKIQFSNFDESIDAYCFDRMIRQLISLQLEFNRPSFFWKMHQQAIVMYENWIKGIDFTGKILPEDYQPADLTQAQDMIEALYHHARLKKYQGSQEDDAADHLTQCISLYCQQARSAKGAKAQTIESFKIRMGRDSELTYHLELAVGNDQIDTLMATIDEALEEAS